MRPLSAWELLSIWEGGLAQLPAQRALMLLAAACPEVSPDELAHASIGQRDARLLTLREWAFGQQLVCLVTCPECGERLELSFKVADIRVESPTPALPSVGEGEVDDGILALSAAGYELRCRLPNSQDLIAIGGAEDVTTARQRLLKRCLLTARRNGEEAAFDQLPDEVVSAITSHMAVADPQAEVRLDLSCPQCSHRWRAIFDILSFFWSELHTWACRTLREVHTLASAYGWREADILAMSPWRRQLYLEMVSRA